MAWIGKRELRNYSVYTLLTKRGKYILSPTEIRSGDAFGMFQKSKIVQQQQSLVVLPVCYKINQFALPPGYLPGGKAIRKRTTAITPHAAGIREYLPGDSMNRIHWKKTAQRGQLIAKEFEEDPQSDIWILLDSQMQSHYQSTQEQKVTRQDRLWTIKQRDAYQLPCDTYEYAVSVVASLADHFIRIGQGVGFHHVGKQSLLLPPEKGFRQLEKIMESLAYIKPDGNSSFEAEISAYIRQIMPGSLVLVVAPDTATGLVQTAQFLKSRKVFPYFILLDRNSFAISDYKNTNSKIGSDLHHMGIGYKIIRYGESIANNLEK